MPSWFRSRKAPSPECIGLGLYADGFAACVVDRASNRLVSAHFQPAADDKGLAEALQLWVREAGLRGRNCRVCLAPEDYKLLPAEAPAVPDNEINQALLWGLRDVIDSKPEDTALDSFAGAAGVQRSGKPVRQVAVARKERLRAVVDAVLGAGLDLDAIEIPELCQRNVIARLPENAVGAGIVSQNSRGVSVTLYRGGELYVSRHLAGIADLGDAGHPLTAPRLVDQLGLELLRTLDYYDSQLRQRPPAAIFLQPLPNETRPLLDGLSSTINVPARQLRYADIIDGGENVPADALERCFTALGAALRDDAAGGQQINLYTKEFQPRREWLSAKRCAQLWGGSLAAGLLIGAALAWHNHDLRGRAAALQAQLDSEKQALTQAQTSLQARVPSPALTRELRELSAERAAKTELLAALKTNALSGSRGYTPILRSLARNTVDGLWLTAIAIAGNDVDLMGATRSAELVPTYIDKIVNAHGFGARSYESVAIKADANGILTFALRGHRRDDLTASR